MNPDSCKAVVDPDTGLQLSRLYYPYLIENSKENYRFVLYFCSFREAVAYCESRGLTVL